MAGSKTKTPEPEQQNTEYRVLALKYRPQTFTSVVGQTAVVRQLQGEIRDNRVGHAYLFTGPRGVGKTSMARIFAKALNCVEGPTPDPCGKCTHCLGIANDSDLDVVEVDAATYTKKEETIELLEGIDRATFNSRYKVYIIDEVHMFSNHSFNVLLKRLEEPPPGVVFILATTNPEKIPETVISRCRRLEFDRMEAGDIVGRLREICDRENVEFPDGDRDKVLEAVALASEGGMRDAQVALDQLISLSDNKITLESARQLLGFVETDLLFQLLNALTTRNTVEALLITQQLVDRGRDLHRFIKTFTTFLRDAMLLKANAPAQLLKVSRANPDELRKAVDGLSLPALLNIMQQFLDLEERMRGAAPARFLLEFTLMKLTAIHPRFVLDSLDGKALKQASAPGEAKAGKGSETPKETPSARVLTVERSDDHSAPRAAIMREPALQVEPLPNIEVDGPEEVHEFPPSEDSLRRFVAAAGNRLPILSSVLADAEMTFPSNAAMSIRLAAKDSAMVGTLQRPEQTRMLRDASRECFGREFAMSISVAPQLPAEDAFVDAEAEEFLPEHPPADPIPVNSSEEHPVAGELPARALSFAEAMERFADLREVVELVRRHCNIEPAMFNGQRLN